MQTQTHFMGWWFPSMFFLQNKFLHHCQMQPLEKEKDIFISLFFLKDKKSLSGQFEVRALLHCHNHQNCHFVVKACPPFCWPSRDWFISKPYCSVSWTPLSSSSSALCHHHLHHHQYHNHNFYCHDHDDHDVETWKVFSQQEESV